MKKKILYWVVTGLFAVAMILSAIPQLLMIPESNAEMSALGYPVYIVPFLGLAKLLGAAAILIPRFPRLKEWAFAGLFFDLIAALYSHIIHDGWQRQLSYMVLPFALLFLSYTLHHKKIASQEAIK